MNSFWKYVKIILSSILTACLLGLLTYYFLRNEKLLIIILLALALLPVLAYNRFKKFKNQIVLGVFIGSLLNTIWWICFIIFLFFFGVGM